MDNINVPVFAQAKIEYTKQLIDILYIHIFDGFSSIYNESKKIYLTKTGIPILNIFRKLLENVPLWNNEIIEEETSRIVKVSKCDWLEDLVTAVFISHTRILMSIGPNQNTNKLNVSVPKTPNFIHKIYINIARDLWKNPYLYNENVAGHDRQRNMNNVEGIIKLNIETTVRKELPVKEILRGHLDTYENNEKLDIQMILNEIKKNPEFSYKSDEETTENSAGDGSEDREVDENRLDHDSPPHSDSEKDSEPHSVPEPEQYSEPEPNLPPEQFSVGQPTVEKYDNVDIVEEKKEEDTSSLTDNIYNDPNDPTPEEIKKNTADIVVNDITLPVEDPSPQPSKLPDIKTPDIKTPDIKTPDIKAPEITDPDTKPPENKDVKMFSFDTLYPGMKTFGSITKDEEKKDSNTLTPITENQVSTTPENIDKTVENISQNNDTVLKEVMKLDKEGEKIDDTETLDNFLKDIKEIASKSDKNIDVNTKENTYTFFD
jgi:hypothetical protein